ncbi:Ig-like domain-containing protein [Shewanella sp. KCT]|uniref:Ig-like domain-containing protein n=1 Tax=Shewanella sp. KCT TaxID=2569535 RepID=UPI001182941F|nr:Ig-like domain-containing protein [Shewanella sp. KCT]TVP16016.1 peptidase M11 [Shewanella sp. KCT]
MSSVHCAAARTDSTFLKTFGLGLLGAGLLSASAIMPVHAGTHGEQTSAAAQAKREAKQQARLTHKSELETQTLQLSAVAAQYLDATKSNGVSHASDAALYQQLEALVAARQVEQQALLEIDPYSVVSSVLPMAKRRGMPAEIQAKLAQKKAISGELEMVYEDFGEAGENRLRHFLITDNEHVELHLPDNTKAKFLKSGMALSVKGWLFNSDATQKKALVLNHEPEAIQYQTSNGTSSVSSTGTTSELNTIGEQKSLVLLINFQDNANEKPWSIDEVRTMIFERVSDYYREASYGKTWLSGDVQGYFTLPINATCDSWDIYTNAQQQAENNGINTDAYDRIIYLFPKNNSCSWTGMGTLGGAQSRAYINGSFTLNTIGHELGHNFGLYHAKRLECSTDVIGDSCYSVDYGDSLDIMGKFGVEGHFTAFNKELLGWLSADRGEIITADSDGTFLLEPYETNVQLAPKGLKVRRGTDSLTGNPLWYYLEYRQAIGFDGFLQGKQGITDGVVLHLATQADPASSELLDLTPSSAIYDLDDVALLDGTSYTDNDAGVTFTTEKADSTGVEVTVAYLGGTCVQVNPTLALSQNSDWVAPGTAVTYSATVTNKDSLECGDSQFSVSVQVPANWSASSASLSLAPGATANVSFSVVSSGDANDGFYDLDVTAYNAQDSNLVATGLVSYVVQAPVAQCVLAAPQFVLTNNSSGEVAPGTGVVYQGTVTNLDSDSCDARDFNLAANVPAGWSATATKVNLAPGQSQNVSLTVTSSLSAADGQFDFNLIASNGQNAGLQSSANASYTVLDPAKQCTLAQPNVSVSGGAGEYDAGSLVPYTVTVTNQNADSCADAVFAISAAVPQGWNANGATVSLASGQSTSVVVSVSSAQSATAGAYGLGFSAADKSDNQYQASAQAQYKVAQQANTAPVAVNDSASVSSGSSVIIAVLSNDSDPEGDTLTVVSVTQGSKGSVTLLADGSVKYTPGKRFKGSDSFSYTISDGELTATATVTISQSSDSTGGGTGGKGNGKK